MRFSPWIAGDRGRAADAARFGLRGQRRPERDRAQPRQGRAQRHRPRPALQMAAGGNRARVRPPPAGAGRRTRALPDLRAQGRQRRLLRRRPDLQRARVLSVPPVATSRWRSSAWRRSSRTRCATRSTRARCSKLVSGDRAEIIGAQLDSINKGAATLGVDIVDLRIKRIDLPTDSEVITTSTSACARSASQVASRLRAEGEEQARTIRAQADRAAGGVGGRSRTRRAEAARRGRRRSRRNLRAGGQDAIPRSMPSTAAWRRTASRSPTAMP